MEKYLTDLILNAKVRLEDNENDLSAYRNLLDGIFCTVMIFNKRRVGELQRMTSAAFLENHGLITSSEFEKVLSNSEKILYRSLKRIVIRGKRGRGVPVLFDQKTTDCTTFLLSVRNNFNLENNPFLFGMPGTVNPISGYVVMRKHALIALKGDKSRASLLTSTRLRKQLATITQIFKMTKDELEQLAKFMGHTEKTHAEFYRLPDDVYQTAKVSKLLLLSSNSVLFNRYKGKPLSEIEIDDSLIEESGNEEEEEIYPPRMLEPQEIHKGDGNEKIPSISVSNAETSLSNVQPNNNQKRKRQLVAWTQTQKQTAEKFFKYHIKNKVPPKKHEILTLMDQNPGLFNNKKWPVIKVYVCNKYKSVKL